MADKVSKNRQAKGKTLSETLPKKLKEQDVIEIRILLKTEKLKDIAEKYGVTSDLIRAIKHRKIWKHVL